MLIMITSSLKTKILIRSRLRESTLSGVYVQYLAKMEYANVLVT